MALGFLRLGFACWAFRVELLAFGVRLLFWRWALLVGSSALGRGVGLFAFGLFALGFSRWAFRVGLGFFALGSSRLAFRAGLLAFGACLFFWPWASLVGMSTLGRCVELFEFGFSFGIIALGFSLSGFCICFFELRFPRWAFRVGPFALLFFCVGLLAFGFPLWAFALVVSPLLLRVGLCRLGCFALGFSRLGFRAGLLAFDVHLLLLFFCVFVF